MKKFNLRNLRAKSAHSAFTLVELLVVMAIIAILVTLIIYAINIARMQSRNTQRRNLMNAAKSALEAYYSTYKDYPDTPSNSTVAELLGTGGDLEKYKGGLTDVDDPNGSDEDTRECYEKNTKNKYWMYLLPEPEDDADCDFTTTPPAAPKEDFSVQ